MPPSDRADVSRRDRWETATRVPLLMLGGVFIVSYSMWVLWETMPALLRVLVGVALLVTWVAFALDIAVRLVLSPRGTRFAFLRSHPLDVLSVALPMFRAFRVIVLWRSTVPHQSSRAVRGDLLAYLVATAAFFVYFLALAALEAERHAPGATITSFGDAVWWACVTLATVGYGDTYPVTVLGRIYAVVLMVGGIAIIGTTSALVISFILDRVRAADRQG
ncbi:potassium channel family protein [Schumannella luteola]